jgi:hypothetical protein
MKHLLPLILLAACSFGAPDALSATHDVQFAQGAKSVRISGSVVGRGDERYQIRTREGQTMRVTLRAQRPTTYFNVNPPGGDQAIFIGSNSGTTFEGRLPVSGVYEIIVYQMGGAASGNTRSRYELAISLTSGYNSGSSEAAFGAGQVVVVVGVRSQAVDALELLDGPGGRGRIVGRVGNGRLLTVDKCEGDWCHVSTATGAFAAGWIETSHLRSK